MNFEFYTLANGVRVVLVPMAGVESVAVGVFVGAGTRDENWETNGVAHFLEHMVFKGTRKFPTRQQTSVIEGYGAIQNGWTYSEATSYWAKLPADRWKLGLEVQKELALYPRLRQVDLEKEKGVILEEIHRRDDTPEDKVGEVFYHMRFPQQSLGWSTLGRPEVIKRLDREDFAKFHRQNYVSGSLVVLVAGKLETGTSRQIEEWFGALPGGKSRERKNPQEAKGPQVEIVSKPDAQQVHLVLGVGAFTMGDDRRFALALANRILGYGLSSRLFMEVREKRGLAYAVHSDYELEVDHGYWAVYAGVKTEKLAAAVKVMVGELKKLAEVKVGGKELGQAKEKVRGPLIFTMENPYYQMEWYAKQALWRPQEILTHRQVIDRVMDVTGDELRRVAADLFRPERLNLAVVGPVDKREQEAYRKILEGWR